MLQYNDKVFQIGTMRIFNFLMYREDIKSYLIEKGHIFICNNLSYNNYYEYSETEFEKQFLINKEDILEYLKEQENADLKVFIIPQKMLDKKEYLEKQLECLIKNNKPIEHIKSWKRAIKRIDKKILARKEIFEKEQEKIKKYYNDIRNKVELNF